LLHFYHFAISVNALPLSLLFVHNNLSAFFCLQQSFFSKSWTFYLSIWPI
jgi:hypothetical protein